MLVSRTLQRIGSAAVLSALTLGLLAIPSAAAGKTRAVDDDGKGTAASCDASASTYKSIQKAVNASGAGDIVKVCPGTYKGRVKITGARTGLQLLSSTSKGATIKDPDVSVHPLPPLVLIDGVSDVVVKGFKIRTLSWESYLSETMDGIVADNAKHVTIRGNDLGWSGAAGDRSNLMNGITAQGGTTGVIRGNAIKDALTDGIHVSDAGTDVTVEGNAISVPFAGNDSSGDDGIEVRTSAKAIVKGNTITAPAVSSGIITNLAAGVELYNASGATVVKENTVTNPIVGIVTRGNGYDLLDNRVTGRQVGIELVNSDNLTVTGNRAKATIASPGYGIAATEASDNNTIKGNNVKGSAGPDCYENTDDTDGIDNTWSLNDTTSVNDADPDGLCTYSDEEVPA